MANRYRVVPFQPPKIKELLMERPRVLFQLLAVSRGVAGKLQGSLTNYKRVPGPEWEA